MTGFGSGEVSHSYDDAEFNFWPSFTDLMLSLVLIMVVIVFCVGLMLSVQSVDLQRAQASQREVIQSVARQFGGEADELGKDQFGIRTTSEERYDLTIQNEASFQSFRFSDRILFQSDEYELTERGRDTLMRVGIVLKQELGRIKEIQIQGHADTDPTYRTPSNLHLGALRAIAVFQYLREQVGIDPVTSLMSATSFGEFKPVGRGDEDQAYNRVKLVMDNETVELRSLNRRIEVLVFYRIR